MDILKQTLASLPLDTDLIIRNVAAIALEAIQAGEQGSWDTPERLEQEIGRIVKKKEAVLDAFFSQDITKEEMQRMGRRYEEETDALRQRLQAIRAKQKHPPDAKALQEKLQRQVTAILRGETESEIFYKTILDHMTVFKEHRVEVKLNFLPMNWVFLLEKAGKADYRVHYGASVPISVSSPFSSSKGME